MKMGLSVLRRVAGGAWFSRSAGFRTHCSLSGRICALPWLMLPPVFDDSGKVAFKFHGLGNGNGNREAIGSEKLGKLDKVYFAGSSHGWLAVHNWANRELFLLNPTTGRQIQLPSVRAEGCISRLALSCSPDDDDDCRAMIVFGRERRLAFCVPGRSTEWTPIGGGSGGRGERKYDDVAYSSTYKRFLCITTETGLTGGSVEVGGFRFTTKLEGGFSEVEGWDITHIREPRIDWRLQNNDQLLFDYEDYPWPARSEEEAGLKRDCWHTKYILVHDHDLFVVVRHVNPRLREGYIGEGVSTNALYISKYRGWDASHPYKTFDFDVYKIDWRGSGDVMYMKCSLEGLVMFVGNNHSFALSSSSSSELKPNCIYFTDENSLMRKSRSFVDNEFGGHDNGIFDYKNNTFSTCCGNCPLKPMEYNNIKRIDPPPMWFAPPTLAQ
ncbi:hypothetical protein OROMI_030239 [Orobanche minor]